jgi:hypothetical protein
VTESAGIFCEEKQDFSGEPAAVQCGKKVNNSNLALT